MSKSLLEGLDMLRNTALWILAAVLFLFVLAGADAAEMRFESPELSVTLQDTPCSNASVLEMIKPESREFYQDGSVTVPGRTVKLCWRVAPSMQEVWIVDEEGEAVRIPITLFAPKQEDVI
jgi:hypothetical protein